MDADLSLSDLFSRGGVYKNIFGSTAEELFVSISKTISVPSEITPEQLYDALCRRERISTTAVGNGIAIPHSSVPLFKNSDEQKIAICYLKEPVDMGAADHRKVYVMFVILTSNMHSHMKVISKIADFLKKSEVRKALEAHVDLGEILNLLSYEK